MTREELIEVMAKAHLSYGRHPALRSPVPMQGDIDAMSDALSALEAAGVRLVPSEATDRMMVHGEADSIAGCYMDEIWRSMLAASPYASGD